MSEAARPSLWPEEAFYPLRALVTVIQPTDAPGRVHKICFSKARVVSGCLIVYCGFTALQRHMYRKYTQQSGIRITVEMISV